MMQALSDSVSAILVQDGNTRPLRAVWHHSNASRTITGHDPSPTGTLMARVAPTARGGGAVIVAPSAKNGSKRQLVYAVGGRIDSIEHQAQGQDPTRVIQTGMALWSGNGSTKPTWHIAGDHFLHTVMDSLGIVSNVGSGYVTRPYAMLSSKLHIGGNGMLLTTADVSMSDRPQSFTTNLLASMDGGVSWMMRALPTSTTILSVDRNGFVLSVRDGSVHMSTIYSSTSRTILSPRGTVRGAIGHGDTILVLADRTYRTVDGGQRWDSTTPAGYVPSPVLRTSLTGIVTGSPTNLIITTDIGRTWRSVSVSSDRYFDAAATLSDGTVYGSVSSASGVLLLGSDGTSTHLPGSGGVTSVGDDIYVGDAKALRRFDRRTGTLEDDAHRIDAYADLGVLAYLGAGRVSSKETAGRPISDGSTTVYIVQGDRLKGVCMTMTPTSVAMDGETFTTRSAVHPNPAHDHLTLPAGRSVIRTVTGAIVSDVERDSEHTIDVRSLPQGTYYVETTNGPDRSVVPVVIVR
jgi:hypothetical protein